MLSAHGRRPAAHVVEPAARLMLRLGLSPNTVTVASATVAVVLAVVLIPTGHLVAAAILTGVFAAFDMIDGTMARMQGGGTKYGATLDASCDRITDGAFFAAIVWWLVYSAHAAQHVVFAALIVVVGSQVISYVKARGEASGLEVEGGFIERPERLIIGLLGLALTGVGVAWALPVALWILAIGTVLTIVQRLYYASRSRRAQEPTTAPRGARTYQQ